MVTCELLRALTFGHQQLVRCELSSGSRICGMAVCTMSTPDSLRTIVWDRRSVKQA